MLRALWQQKSHAALSRINLARVGNSVALFILAVMHRSTFSLLFPDPKGHPPPGRLEMSLQAQLGRLHITRRHRVTFLHYCVHSMATNPNSEPSQPPSSFTVALQHGSSKLPRLISQHCLRASKQKLQNPKRISSLRMAELAALPLIIIPLTLLPTASAMPSFLRASDN